jgi:hypothetical protein
MGKPLEDSALINSKQKTKGEKQTMISERFKLRLWYYYIYKIIFLFVSSDIV